MKERSEIWCLQETVFSDDGHFVVRNESGHHINGRGAMAMALFELLGHADVATRVEKHDDLFIHGSERCTQITIVHIVDDLDA